MTNLRSSQSEPFMLQRRRNSSPGCNHCFHTSSQFSEVCTPSNAGSNDRPKTALEPNPYKTALKRISNMPLMRTVLDIVQTQPQSATIADMEEDVLAHLQEKVTDPNTPWSKLLEKRYCITGNRTLEHYICAIDVALAARTAFRNECKKTKYWKALARDDSSALVTPSPSDISETGIVFALPHHRQELLNALVEKRNEIVGLVDEFKGDSLPSLDPARTSQGSPKSKEKGCDDPNLDLKSEDADCTLVESTGIEDSTNDYVAGKSFEKQRGTSFRAPTSADSPGRKDTSATLIPRKSMLPIKTQNVTKLTSMFEAKTHQSHAAKMSFRTLPSLTSANVKPFVGSKPQVQKGIPRPHVRGVS